MFGESLAKFGAGQPADGQFSLMAEDDGVAVGAGDQSFRPTVADDDLLICLPGPSNDILPDVRERSSLVRDLQVGIGWIDQRERSVLSDEACNRSEIGVDLGTGGFDVPRIANPDDDRAQQDGGSEERNDAAAELSPCYSRSRRQIARCWHGLIVAAHDVVWGIIAVGIRLGARRLGTVGCVPPPVSTPSDKIVLALERIDGGLVGARRERFQGTDGVDVGI